MGPGRWAVVGLLLASALLVSGCSGPGPGPEKVKRFASLDELKRFVQENGGGGLFGASGALGLGSGASSGGFAAAAALDAPRLAPGAPSATPAPAPRPEVAGFSTTSGGVPYSTTNIQVAGVDEPDIVKTDGKHLYALSGNRVSILEAYPAPGARILANLAIDGSPQEMFIGRERLLVFGTRTAYTPPPRLGAALGISPPPSIPTTVAFATLYDVSSPSAPVVKLDFTVDGLYFDSRLVGDRAYVVVNQPVSPGKVDLPTVTTEGVARDIPATDIAYAERPEAPGLMLVHVLSLSLPEGTPPESRVFLMGQAQGMFVSENSIYLTYPKTLPPGFLEKQLVERVLLPALPPDKAEEARAIDRAPLSPTVKALAWAELFQKHLATLSPEEQQLLMADLTPKSEPIYLELANETQKTVVHRISFRNGSVSYAAGGEVRGTHLNQYSMDEHNGYFRIATTATSSVGTFRTSNNVYVLDPSLQVVGRLEGLAGGERIFAARFLGDRAYLVTFRQVDPLFVLDLSTPSKPSVLGQLKIPGFSNYLHPYDRDHIIGIGKEASGGDGGLFTATDGLKMALFDITDVRNPREKAKTVIGHRGTDSEVLQDPKALLFDRSRGLLVLPITLAEINKTRYSDPSSLLWATGDTTFQGAYVFNASLDEGFRLKGRIAHVDPAQAGSYYYYSSSPSAIRRSLYIGDVLYTVSGAVVKLNDLTTLSELRTLHLS